MEKILSQKVGQQIAQFKRAASQVQEHMQSELLSQPDEAKQPDILASIFLASIFRRRN